MGEPLTIIAGEGNFPRDLARIAHADGREVSIGALTGFCDPDWLNEFPFRWFKLGEAQRFLDYLDERACQTIAFAGAVKRPSLTALKMDRTAAGFVARIGPGALGDDGLLQAIEREFARRGIKVLGVPELAASLLAPPGALTNRKPTADELALASIGLTAAKTIGALDIGQAVVVADGRVVAVEGSEGTNALIERVQHADAILVKASKPQQSKALDLPSFGGRTVAALAKQGFAGAVIEAEKTLLLDRAKTIAAADTADQFIYAI